MKETLESLVPWRFRKKLQAYRLRLATKHYDRAVAATPVYPAGGDSPGFEVHSLLGTKHLGMCLWSVKSFLHSTGRKFNIVLHDDGTLTPMDLALIEQHIPGAVVFQRSVSDELIAPYLRAYSNIEAYRFGRFGYTREGLRRSLFSLKILDFNLLTNAKKILVLDTDVLFFKRPVQLLDWIDDKSDAQCLYCYEDYFPVFRGSGNISRFERKVTPRCYFNSGLIGFDKSVLNLRKLDTWLGTRQTEIDKHYTFEQKAYNFVVHQAASHRPLPETYSFNYTDSDCVATHFGIKALFFENLRRLEFFAKT
jgi:hypothetical protein